MRSVLLGLCLAGGLALGGACALATPFDSGGVPISNLHFRVAYARAQRGRFSAALAQMNTAIDGEPTFADGYLYRARLEMNIGRYADAAADLDRFAARQPHTRIAALYRAKCALLQGQGAAARGFLDRAAKLPFGDTEHVTTRIYSYFSDAEFYAFRSLADLLLGRNDAALADFKITVKAQAKNEGPIMNDICHIGGVAGLFDFAVLACQESIATQWVDSSRPYANLAYIQLREHKWADAITNETKALAREGGYTPALYGRGIARIASGARSSGEADLARARAREPDIDTIMASLHAPTEATLADPAADAAANPAQAIRQPDTTQQGLVDLAPVHVSPH